VGADHIEFVQARRLLQEQPVACEAVSTGGQIGTATTKTQILHVLYVAAYATAVGLTTPDTKRRPSSLACRRGRSGTSARPAIQAGLAVELDTEGAPQGPRARGESAGEESVRRAGPGCAAAAGIARG
jgi:hypothetical protein